MRGLLSFALTALALAGPALGAEVPVDLELVLAADASRSIDEDEYDLQRRGYVSALTHPDIIRAILSGPIRAIAVTYVEWSAVTEQATLVDWAVIRDAASARAFAERLAGAPRVFRSATSISGAIDYAARLFDGNGIEGTRRVIDVSGDGPNNSGARSETARDAAVAKGVTINGLAIVNDRPSRPPFPEEPVDRHYARAVIGGPGAFMMTVAGFETFGDAIRRKLVREIANLDEDHSRRGRSERGPDVPQLRKKSGPQRFPEIGDAGGAAGAAFGADDALDRRHVAEPPLLEPVLEIDQLLGQFIDVPMGLRVAIDLDPGVAHRRVR
jgi:hypothetical protein